MPEEQNRGQDFVSQRNLKNQLFGKRNEDVGALNRTMSSFSTRNIKALDSLTKQITNLNKNLVSMAKPSQQKKDFVRREDPMKKFIKEIDDLEELTKEQLKLDKEKQKKGKGLLTSLLGLFGGGLALSGLIGYFMTGKKEMLNSVVKGLMKYSPLKIFTKGIDMALKGAFRIVGKGISKIPGIKTLGKKIGTSVVKNIGKFVKPISGIFKGIGKVFKPIANIFGKGLLKTAGKSAGKGVGKAFLKKIPIIGSLMGLFFGIGRFKQGDYFGALLEVASGLSSMIPIPGVGTALGIAIDSFLIFRDLKGREMVDSKIGEAAANVGKKVAPAILRNIPVVGTVIRFMDGIKLWKTNKIEAMKKIGGAVASLVPGGGWIFDTILTISDKFGKDKESDVDAVTGAAPQAAPQSAKQKKGLLQKFKKKVASSLGGMVSGAQEMIYETGRPERDSRKRGIESIAGERGVGWYTYKPWSPQIRDLNKGMWNNFTGMAREYFNETGDLIQINSAYRNQRGSVHGAGYAIDINSSNANALERMGLMKKWGFHRPLLNWEKKKETWHVEPYPGEDYGPRNTNNFAIRHAVAQGKTDFGGGGLNMPRNQIAGKANPNQKEKLDLSDSTIQALANAMGASFKGAIPRQSRGALGASAEMRG